MSAAIIPFPRPRRSPNNIEVRSDAWGWWIAHFHDQRLVSSLNFRSKVAAETEALRLAESGMVWRMGPNGSVYIMPVETNGGYWAVAHQTSFGRSKAILGRYLSIDAAVQHAVRSAATLKACLSIRGPMTDMGGVA